MYELCAEKNYLKQNGEHTTMESVKQKHFNITQIQKNDHAEIVKHFKVTVRYYRYIADFKLLVATILFICDAMESSST